MPAHVQISCCHQGCYAIITLHPDDEQRLRRSHEWFYCPAGHRQHFTGKTEQEKRIEKLEHDVKVAERMCDRWRELREGEREIREQLQHSIQVCPLGCGWRGRRRLAHRPGEEDIGRFLDRVGRDLTEHLIDAHNATRAPVALLTAGDPVEAR